MTSAAAWCGSVDRHRVDGIITDYPDRLRDLLETCGYQLPRHFGRS